MSNRPRSKSDILGNLPTTPYFVDGNVVRPAEWPGIKSGRTRPFSSRSGPSDPTAPIEPATADHGAFPNHGLASPERFDVIGEIARGGMGELLSAHDRVIGREVALKVLKSEFRSPEAEARFLREARINGQLQHPGIVPVYDVGRLADGRPFMAMLLVRGTTLESALGTRPSVSHQLPLWIHVFEQVCHAVAYAHSKGVIHRDLKPHNVILSGFGQVRVLDWGLAKVLEEDDPDVIDVLQPRLSDSVRMSAQGLTGRGSPVGTPGYMPPEQARGEHSRIDQRADVFGLGAILTVILTGRPPFDHPSQENLWTINQMGEITPAYARLDRCGAPPLLVGLAKWCLAPNPLLRPRDAQELVSVLAESRSVVSGAWSARFLQQPPSRWGWKSWRLRLALAAATGTAFLAGGLLGLLAGQ